MKENFKRIFFKIQNFFSVLYNNSQKILALWPDIWAIPFAVIGFFVSFYILRWIDPYAGTFDIGYLQALFLSSVFIVFANALVFLGVKFNFRYMWDHYKDNTFQKDWTKLTPWQRLIIFFWLYSLLFFLSAVVFTALI